jgi:hypothetical protein
MALTHPISIIFSLIILSVSANASAVDGKWIFKKNNSDNLDRALNIQGSSFTSLITTPEGAAYESGWWTENATTAEGKTSVVVRYGDNPPDTILYKMDGLDKAIIWTDGDLSPWGTMTRMNCDLSMQYRNKSDPAPAGCAWLHIRGWGYSGLEGECVYDSDWETNGDGENDPMTCLIEAPAKFVQ